MAVSDLFPDFGEVSAVSQAGVIADASLDDLRLQSYELGYSAGWEDSQKATDQTNLRASESLARNLEDLSFTYAEVRQQMCIEVEPFFDALFRTLVPSMVESGAVEKVKQDLVRTYGAALPQGAEIAVSCGEQSVVAQLMQAALPMPLTIVEDPCLQASQVVLRAGGGETLLDLETTLKGIEQEFSAHFAYAEKEEKVG